MNVKSISKLVRSNLNILIPLLLLLPFYIILYKIYIPRVNAFGCFDDCFNYLGGYFIANGKHIYSDFFFNHQPIPAFLSYVIQTITHPINIFDLVLKHRQALMLFGLLFNALLILRFKLSAFFFVIIFELSKFYVFGDRFLAEGIIVYPIVYLAGLVLLKFSKRKLFTIDYLLFPAATWFVIFSREPYIPLALFLFLTILWAPPGLRPEGSGPAGGALPWWGKFDKIKKTSLAIFAGLSIITLLYIFDIKEYFFNVMTVNQKTVFASEAGVNQMSGPKILQTFLYPFYVFSFGGWNLFKQLLIGINLVFLLNFTQLIKDRKLLLAALIFIILGLSNLRVVLPGSLFYASFHMIIWYALFIFITSFLIFNHSNLKFLRIFSITILILFLASFLSSKFYFAKEKIDQHAELLTNYGETMQIGEVVKILSNPSDTLFLDGSDDLIYWQAQRTSPYKYSWYTSVMRHFPKYSESRLDMFKNNPPDFYKEFGSCPKKSDIGESYRLPDFVADQYVRLYNLESPSCLFVRKDKIGQISDPQWQKAKEHLYSIPSLNKDQP